MIVYEPKNWTGTLLRYKNTVIPHVLPRVLGLTGLAALAVLGWSSLDPSSDLYKAFSKARPTGHTLIGVALGLLIVFRNNASYDRFWEGRRLWGTIINNARSLIRGVRVYAGPVDGFDGLLRAYPLALKAHLGQTGDFSETRALIPPAVFEAASKSPNFPAHLAGEMSRWIEGRLRSGRIDSQVARMLEAYVHTLVDSQGGCERILRTPIPFVYAVHIKQLLFIYLATLPVVLVPELYWWAVPAVAAISFGLLGIEDAGVEIEDPFGDDPNDLPLGPMCETIQRDVSWAGE